MTANLLEILTLMRKMSNSFVSQDTEEFLRLQVCNLGSVALQINH